MLTRFAPPAVRLWAGFGRQTRRLARFIRQHPVDLFHTQNTGCEESPVAARLRMSSCRSGIVPHFRPGKEFQARLQWVPVRVPADPPDRLADKSR